MQASIQWLDNVSFKATSESGHTVILDGAPEYGGQNLGARPMELILMGLGGCASFDIVTILKKARQDISNVECQLQAQRSQDIPAVFTQIHLHFVVTGRALKDKQVARAVELSAEKYCSASKMLRDGGVDISHDYQIIEVDKL